MIDALTIDIYRLGYGNPGDKLSSGKDYVALTGTTAPPKIQSTALSHDDLLRNLYALRYPVSSTISSDAATVALGEAAADILPMTDLVAGGPMQVDLVLGAPELWVVPFEACRDSNGNAIFADPNRQLILTRRIRQGLAAEHRPWPAVPHVLFLHAPETGDLSQELIDAHVEALVDATRPWSASGDPVADGLLHVRPLIGTADIAKALTGDGTGPNFTHVHFLAHGKEIPDPEIQSSEWGLRLGDVQRNATPPSELAEQFADPKTQPVVVTVAVCDAGNAGNPATPKESFAQELHKRGIPVVLAPQLPLTQPGSITLTRAFYKTLFDGADVRVALHEARLALRNDTSAEHDWLALTGYLQLPAGYGSYLLEVGVRRDMERLKAARERLARLAPGTSAEEFNEIASELEGRVQSLTARLGNIPATQVDLRSECQGVLASAQKRIAQFNFDIADRSDRGTAADRLALSRRSLEESVASYGDAFMARTSNHWLGVQWLCLEAVLHGSWHDQFWATTRHAAERDIAGAAHLDGRSGRYWAYGTLAELWLLAAMSGSDSGVEDALETAKNALAALVTEVDIATNQGDANASYAVASTRDQLQRYVDWWTSPNGYFPGTTDLSTQASSLVEYLDEQTK